MVDWAGLEIRSLSQDRGFESLSLLEKKNGAVRFHFSFYTLCRGLLAGTKKPNLAVELFKYPVGRLAWVYKKETSIADLFLYPQAVSNRCCGNENPESWATRR